VAKYFLDGQILYCIYKNTMTNRFHNPELHKHLKAATKEASGLLKGLVNKLQAVPTQEKVDKKLRKDITNELGTIVVETIPNEPSFKSCVEYLAKEKINEIKEKDGRDMLQEIKDIFAKVDVETGIEIGEINEEMARDFLQKQAEDKAENQVWNRIGEYLNCLGFGDKKYKTMGIKWNNFREFNEQTFDEYYAEYEQFLYSNLPVKYQIVASLENFNYTLPSSDIILSGNTRIVSNREKHIEGFCSSTPTYDIDEDESDEQHYKSQFLSNFWLEIDCEIEKVKLPFKCKEYIEHTSLEEVKKVFKILRLYKEGDFRQGVIYWRPTKVPFGSPYAKKLDFCVFERYDTSNKYLLQMDDVNKLQLLFQKYSNNLNKKGFPQPAINYLDKGVRGKDTLHRLVDYVAALESFLVDGKEGISTLLAHRTAFFLEKDKQKCKEIYKDIKKAYGLRSNIVHGDHHKIKDELEFKEYCNKTESYVRRAIIQWINMIDEGKNRQEIYDSIEENLFS